MRDTAHHTNFQNAVWRFFKRHGRDMPWRQPEPAGYFDPYKIMVSEYMLQQTQVSRVIPKFEAFIRRFPTIESLAEASLGEVLIIWNGLGYNRRAKFLHQAAGEIVSRYGAQTPSNPAQLTALPGIGASTAAAICVYAFNQPLAFVETNIRSVYLHHFFVGQVDVSDAAILPLVASTLDKHQPRVWYWALMDYGDWLKRHNGNAARQSKHYVKQARFEGSSRQLRGAVIRLLTQQSLPSNELHEQISDQRLPAVLDQLISEGLIRQQDDTVALA